MNIIMNRLPTKTWNRLNMNEARVSLEGEFVVSVPSMEGGAPAVWTPEKAYTGGHGAELAPITNGHPASVLELGEEQHMETPAVLCYNSAEKSVGHLVLRAHRGSHMQVVVVLQSERKTEFVLETEIEADRDARVELYWVQLVRGTCITHLDGECHDRAKVTVTRLELGADRLYSGMDIRLSGKESDFDAEIGYHGRPGQQLDMNYVALHGGAKTQSLMKVNGTLEEGAKKCFRGTIDFQQGCAGAKGAENENVLLMSDNVVNQTLPVILCKEEDVEGNHGASIGQLDEDVLFYLGSRGISEEEARQMIARARIEAICQKIPGDRIQDLVRAWEQ